MQQPQQPFVTWNHVQFVTHRACERSRAYPNFVAFVRVILAETAHRAAETGGPFVPPPVDVEYFEVEDAISFTWHTTRGLRLVRVRVTADEIVLIPDLAREPEGTYKFAVASWTRGRFDGVVKAAFAIFESLDDEAEVSGVKLAINEVLVGPPSNDEGT